MSFIDYQTFGFWVMCSIEKSIWLHYFHANDSQVRKNYLGYLFFDHSQVENQKYRRQVIIDFWKDTKREVRQDIFKQLYEFIEEEKLSFESKTSQVDPLLIDCDERGEQSLPNQEMLLWENEGIIKQSSDQIKSFSDSSWKDEIMSTESQEYTSQADLNSLIAKANNGFAVESFIDMLIFSKIDRWWTAFDRICRKLLKLIDETQREITLKELLEEDEEPSIPKESCPKAKSSNGKFDQSAKKHRQCTSNSSSVQEVIGKGVSNSAWVSSLKHYFEFMMPNR